MNDGCGIPSNNKDAPPLDTGLIRWVAWMVFMDMYVLVIWALMGRLYGSILLIFICQVDLIGLMILGDHDLVAAMWPVIL